MSLGASSILSSLVTCCCNGDLINIRRKSLPVRESNRIAACVQLYIDNRRVECRPIECVPEIVAL